MSATNYRQKTILAIIAAITIAVLLLATAFSVGKSAKQKSDYISASEKLALHDFADAVSELKEALIHGDIPALNHAAGMAQAYLSRSGLKNCGEVYSVISGICNGEYGVEMCEKLNLAAQKALDGDQGEALRSLTVRENTSEETAAETVEDQFSARILKKIGKGRDDIALKRAKGFACPNAVFHECTSNTNSSFKYSGENIFISVDGKIGRVLMYCFDRDIDCRYSVTEEDAVHTVDMIVKKEKLKLPAYTETYFDGEIYRFTYANEESPDEILLTFEVYSDTGRLRKYDAVNYYRKK